MGCFIAFMISLDISLSFFLLLTFLNYRVQHSVLYPPFIFCATWLFDLTVVRSGLIELDPVHSNTLAIVAIGAASFSLGGLFASLIPRALLCFHLFPPKPRRIPESLRKTLMIVLLSSLPIMFYQIWQLSRVGGNGFNILLQARAASIEISQNEESSLPLLMLGYFSSIATYSSLLFATEKKDRKFWVVSVIALIACVLSTGRTDLLLLISGLSAIRLLQMKQESLLHAMRILRWPVALFAALWIALIFTSKSNEGTTGGVLTIATHAVLVYIVGPLAAFDKVVQYPSDFTMPTSHTFQFPLRLAAAFHLAEYARPPAFDSYVFIPFPMNVYTVFKFYFLELGTIGTEILLLVIGFLHSLLFLKARQGGRFSTYLFAYSMFPVLMVIFDDHYYLTGINFRAIAFGMLYLLVGSVQFRLFSTNRCHESLGQLS